MRISPEQLQAIWYRGAPMRWWLPWASMLYAGLRVLAQLPYRAGLRRAPALDAAVVVVGNLTVGGTGKTPLTMALVEALRAQGLSVGVISRGYGRKTRGVRLVHGSSTAAEVGDEPLLIAQRTRAPVVVGEDRVAAARRLLGAVPVDVLISDDGLEHLALPRCCEIIVVDGQRGFGNRRMLPAGPLRAPLRRLHQVDLVVRNGGHVEAGERAMAIRITGLRPLDAARREPLSAWRGRTAHVVAGTGNPDRVFASVRELGIKVIEHRQADHVDYAQAGIPQFADGLPCITTEKDATKLPGLPGWFVLEVGVDLDPDIVATVIARAQAHLQRQ